MTNADKPSSRRAATGIRSRRGEELTEEERLDYIAAYTERKETLAEIGQRHRRSIEYVRRVLDANGIERRVGHHQGVAEEDLLHMAEQYKKGMSIAAIARSCYASPNTVRQALEKYGVPRRTHFITPEEDAKFKHLYEQEGKTLAEVAEETGRGESTVRVRLVKLGVKMRPHGGYYPPKPKSTTTET